MAAIGSDINRVSFLNPHASTSPLHATHPPLKTIKPPTCRGYPVSATRRMLPICFITWHFCVLGFLSSCASSATTTVAELRRYLPSCGWRVPFFGVCDFGRGLRLYADSSLIATHGPAYQSNTLTRTHLNRQLSFLGVVEL